MSQTTSITSRSAGLVAALGTFSANENASSTDPVRKRVKLTGTEPESTSAFELTSPDRIHASAAELSACNETGTTLHVTISGGFDRVCDPMVDSEADGSGKPSMTDAERRQHSSVTARGSVYAASATNAAAAAAAANAGSSRARQHRRPGTYPAAAGQRQTQESVSGQRRPATMPPKPSETTAGDGAGGLTAPPFSLTTQLESQRGISILLTFTDDSHKHVERVVRLGECLRRNGFGVTVDMPQQCFKTVSDAEAFLRCRFEGSDSVVVCVSPKYKMETESSNGEGHVYHSKFLFELISASRPVRPAALSLGSMQQRPQLLCVYLAETSQHHVPAWLHSLRPLYYQWPQNFRDVLFCLSRPQRMFEMQGFPDLQQALPDSCDLE